MGLRHLKGPWEVEGFREPSKPPKGIGLLKVLGLGLEGFRVQGLGFRVQGAGGLSLGEATRLTRV